jgi:hypothetical protein
MYLLPHSNIQGPLFRCVFTLFSRRAPSHSDKEVLDGILNHPRDLAAARDPHWDRIPVSAAQKWLTRRWLMLINHTFPC